METDSWSCFPDIFWRKILLHGREIAKYYPWGSKVIFNLIKFTSILSNSIMILQTPPSALPQSLEEVGSLN